MKMKEVVIIEEVRYENVFYVARGMNLAAAKELFPGVKIGQKWEIEVDYGGQFPAGEIKSTRLVNNFENKNLSRQPVKPGALGYSL